ncbi:MAG: tRNA (guanosine(46)-N7)-methyltransferase TrmB [Clostridia bacterium]|nr:tRNA (guanosine(46)-N7)-methyltransferase TrmB [Clostridia bacterium]
MRIKLKKWAKEELLKNEFFIQSPIEVRGKWQYMFTNKRNPIHLEIGCGKGMFLANMAKKNPNINFIGIDINDSVLGVACRTVNNLFSDEPPKNLKLARVNANNIEELFDYNDEVDKIYINFPVPWEKPKHNKRRLTYTSQLCKYRAFLKDGGEIFFKTDSEILYKDTLEYFKNANFEIVKCTDNLDRDNIFRDNTITVHEQIYSLQGVTIKAIIAKSINLITKNTLN